jgi:hypothetical protein
MSTAALLPIQSDSASLDALIAKLKRSASPASELLIEHLETAHAYLLGAMPRECIFNLSLARTAAGGLSNAAHQREAEETIDAVLSSLEKHPADGLHLTGDKLRVSDHQPSATAAGLSEFFHGADAKFGTFYPFQYVVAVFPSFERSTAGESLLRQEGLRSGEVLAIPGYAFAEFLEEHRAHRGLGGMLVTLVSRFLDTEVVLMDSYMTWARSGSGFLFAYGKTEAAMESIAQLLTPLGPFSMHGFLTGSIRHLDPKF